MRIVENSLHLLFQTPPGNMVFLLVYNLPPEIQNKVKLFNETRSNYILSELFNYNFYYTYYFHHNFLRILEKNFYKTTEYGLRNFKANMK